MIGGAVALVVAAAVGPLARSLGLHIGAVDHPSGGLKPHPYPVSYLGGLAVAAGVAAGIGAEGWPYPWALPVALFGVAAVGLADDTLGLPPVVRLLAQLGFGVLLAAQGLRADPLESVLLSSVVTVIVFAGAVNAANMVDGMDGLAATTTALSGFALAVVALMHDRSVILSLILAGAALGFLVHNFPPARLFLGNGGSYLAGGGLAVAILLLSRNPALFVGTGTCLGLFGLDLLLSVVRRLVGHEGLLQPDRGHLYDQLLRRGRSVRGTLAVCAGIHVLLLVVGVIATRLETALAVTLCGVTWLGALGILAATGFVRGDGR
ncbi:MAG: undecaprenyl/decaprenyl-phosphate alpha-N-acetylglucosaminyl 1-phosphate transferase [Actinobacteria bacterium]|nr:undecaprenyl/decaprenyl-phosphate alpha-N-acetylglucosaminyl 1-phosphate transferase [Actinomycetota bacterium]